MADPLRPAARLVRGLVVRGELEAADDLVIEGRVEGAARAKREILVEPEGSVDAELRAERVVILGRAAGRVVAGAELEIRAGAHVTATLVAPSVVIAEGAFVAARVEMSFELPEAEA